MGCDQTRAHPSFRTLALTLVAQFIPPRPRKEAKAVKYVDSSHNATQSRALTALNRQYLKLCRSPRATFEPNPERARALPLAHVAPELVVIDDGGLGL